jgi:hypothetical protein
MQKYQAPRLSTLGSFASLTRVTGDSQREDVLVWASRGLTLATLTGYLDACVVNPRPAAGDPCL